MKKIALILSLFLCTAGFALAQRTITGTITNEKNEPVVGASVLVKGTTTGTTTDLDGNYSLQVPNNATTLTVSFVGYGTQDLAVGVSNVINASLTESVLAEVVVTALGISKQTKAIGYAQQTVGGDDLKSSNTLNVVDGLAGKVAGVQITSSSGALGSSSQIILRGQTSLDGNNQALWVIDGMRMDNSLWNTEATTAGVAQSNRAIDLNPNDIENITVLKGAAASALYGVEGARGVILVTTKKGSKKKGFSIEYNSTYTVSQINKVPELQKKFGKGINGQHRAFNSTASQSWGPKLDTMFFDGVANDYDPNGSLVGKSNPLAKTNSPAKVYDPYAVFQNGTGWNNNLSITGGDGEKMSFRLSVGDSRDEGVIPNNTYNRTNINLGTTANLLDNSLHIKSTVSYVKSNSNRIQQGSNLSGLMLGLLRTPPTFDNANGVADPVNDRKAYYLSNNITQRTYRAGTGYDNPYWVINNTPYTDEVNRFLGNLDVTYDLTKWLSINGKVGTDLYQDNRLQKYEINSRTVPGGRVIDDKYTFRSIDAYLNLLGSTNLSTDLTMSYTVGVNAYTSSLENLTVQGDGLDNTGFVNFNNTTSKIVTPFARDQKTFSYFGSLDFGFKNFLYLGLTGRNDWVSNLIVPSKTFNAKDISFFYPSVNMSFVFSELLKVGFMDFGKLRASYGIVGGGAPAPYQTSTVYSVSAPGDGWTDGLQFPYNGLYGLTLSNTRGSLNLRPSKTSDFEVGLETKLLRGKVSLEASYYTRKSGDQILEVPVSSATGFNGAILNTGSLSTKGFDIVLGLTPIDMRNGLRWDVNFNFTKWVTTIESLAEGVRSQYLGGFSPGSYNIPGYQYGQLFGTPFMRANDASGTKYDPKLPYNPSGKYIINSDPTDPDYGRPLVHPQDEVVGNPNPKFLLGINNSFSFKGFTISGLIDIRYGNEMWNGTRGALRNFGMSGDTENRGEETIWDGYTTDGKPNTVKTKLDQSWYTGLGNGFNAVGSQFIEDAGWARLRQLNATYSFNPKWLTGLKMSNLTIGFVGRNLWLNTKYTGVDPETSLTGARNSQGSDYFNMPGTKSWAGTLSVKF